MSDEAFRTEQLAQLYAPQVRALNKLVNDLGKGRPDKAPYVAPHYSATSARVMSLSSNPGPMAGGTSGSGFISCENDDPTAERMARVYEAVGLSTDQCVPWNAYPWYVHDAYPNGLPATLVEEGVDALVRALEVCPMVQVIVAHGGDAHRSARLLLKRSPLARTRGVHVIETLHTSNRAFAASPPVRARRWHELLEAYRGAMRQVGLEPLPATQDELAYLTRGRDRVPELLSALAEYRLARRRLLDLLGLPTSNRDPVPELAEHLVADILGGTVAESRVQAAWDVMTPEGTVQVRTLSNTGSDRWVNEHVIRSAAGADRYALVILEDLTVSAVVVFPTDLSRAGVHLGKRHGDQATTLQITRQDFIRLLADRAGAAAAGVQIWTPADIESGQLS